MDDEFDFVKLFHHYNDHCLPPPGVELNHGGKFFRRVAPQKELESRRKQGIFFTAGLKDNQLLGKNAFGKIVHQIAIDCGLSNPDRQFAASLRPEHINTLVNAEEVIDPKTIMASTRHKTIDAHNVYKRRSKFQLDKKTKAFHAEKKRVSLFLFLFYSTLIFIYSLSVI